MMIPSAAQRRSTPQLYLHTVHLLPFLPPSPESPVQHIQAAFPKLYATTQRRCTKFCEKLGNAAALSCATNAPQTTWACPEALQHERHPCTESKEKKTRRRLTPLPHLSLCTTQLQAWRERCQAERLLLVFLEEGEEEARLVGGNTTFLGQEGTGLRSMVPSHPCRRSRPQGILDLPGVLCQ